jgi:hypothetical protein
MCLNLINMFGHPHANYNCLLSQESEQLLCGVCKCPVNLMLSPVICILLLYLMSIQLQFALGNTGLDMLASVMHIRAIA